MNHASEKALDSITNQMGSYHLPAASRNSSTTSVKNAKMG